MNRLFVPLSSQPFEWFVSGNKKWEVRKLGRQYVEKNVYVNRIVELRKGYTNKSNSIWGTISEVVITDNLSDLLNIIPYEELIPSALCVDEAKRIVGLILSVQPDDQCKLIAFKINKIEKINVISIDNVFLKHISNKTKISTIRYGIREYKEGPGLLCTNDEVIPIIITNIAYKKVAQLSKDDARKDGFDNVENLISTLNNYYPTLSVNDDITIVNFIVGAYNE